jgi:uncharacterized protein (TIGR03086 family)
MSTIVNDATVALGALEVYERSVALFDAVLRQIRPGEWALPTPCADWSVRDLVNHVVGEDRWAPPLLGGAAIADVGTALDGDLLGDDPLAAWTGASAAALMAARTTDGASLVALSFGPTPASEYLRQIGADHLIHAWDLATAIGADFRVDGDLVDAVAGWFGDHESAYRAAGVIGPRPTPALPADADPLERLLSMFGRGTAPDPLASVARFAAAFDTRDVAAIMACMTEDCVFESTAPPDGERFEGQAAVRGAWERLFDGAPSARFTTEESIARGDRVVVRWRYDWAGGHVRGVDLYRVRDGLIAEKLSYVKG